MAAQKPDGKSGSQRVSFTRQGADRIARVVRTVEQGDKKGNALRFGNRPQSAVSSAASTSTTLTTTTITVLTGVVLSTSNMTFLRSSIIVVGETTQNSQIISVYNCPSNSVSSESQAFFFG